MRAILLAFGFVAALSAQLPAFPFPKLALEASSTPVEGTTFVIGNLELSIQKGQLSRVLDGDRPLGFYFQGKGSFRYTTKDRMEFASLASNLQKNSSLKPTVVGGTASLQAELAELLVLDPSQCQELPPGKEALDSRPAFASFLEPFDKSLTPRRDHLFALQRANAPAEHAAWTLVKGKDGIFLHILDPAQTLTESLALQKKAPISEMGWYDIPLSSQPIGWDRRSPALSPVTLTRVSMEVEASSGLKVQIKAKETIRANQNGIKVLFLEVYDQLWDFNGGAAVQHPNHVLKVKSATGQDLPFDHRKDRLLVELPTPLRAGEATELDFTLEGDLLIHPNGDNYWQLGVEPWFPMPPDLSGQAYTVEALIKVPKPYVPLASGTTLSRTTEGDLNVLKIKVDKPIQFFVIQAGKYRIKEDRQKGLTVRVATYADEASDPSVLIRLSQQIIAFYEKLLGPFPFPEFTIIQMHEWGYGQAPPGVMFITNEAFKRTNDEIIGKMFSKGVNARFAHEIAHQYWGHVVKMPNYEEQWITESFADMSAALAVRQMKKQGPSYFEGMVNTWKVHAAESASASSIACANRLRAPNGSRDRQHLIYDKGAYLLDYLRRDLGEGVFLAFLRNFQASFTWKFATTQQMIGFLKFSTKKDYQDLFERCYWGTEMPPGEKSK